MTVTSEYLAKSSANNTKSCKKSPLQSGRILVELIEVNNDELLGEDDIVLFQDRYSSSDLSIRTS